ncbi:Yip1 domain-containing protein [Teratosphaeria nubilosa]|uniref:Protein YIP n=1 Tax=Teratosphaeria nubilosa TaxID=161662 RepID=A0A6G1LGB1_9PEZI|nr:Yip1 domain-containing protein [Teratosphaeria nubilosa]
MANYGYQPNPQQSSYSAQNNLNFYQSSYSQQPVSGHSTPFQAAYGGGAQSNAYAGSGANYGFGAFAGQPGASGQMGTGQSGLRTGWLAAFGTEGYEGEPPLLEELGVNFQHIQGKTLAVLNPLARIDNHIMDDSDLAGPFLFCALFGTFLLLSGKLWFGYVCGLAALGAVSLYFIFSMMSPPLSPEEMNAAQQNSGSGHYGSANLSSTLTFGRSSSVLGYCLLPLVFASLLGVVVPLDSLIGYVVVSLAISWCTYSSSAMFVVVGRMTNMRGLVAYPLALFYVGFGIMAIFSSRGTGRIDAMKAGT